MKIPQKEQELFEVLSDALAEYIGKNEYSLMEVFGALEAVKLAFFQGHLKEQLDEV